MKTLSILIVNLNNLEYTKNCILDLEKQTNQNFSIYLVDQNSIESGTNEYLTKKTRINIIKNKENINLNNVWNNFAQIAEGKYLCYLNNDVRLTNNFVDDTINIFSKDDKIGIVNHVTNNLKYQKTLKSLKYEIFERSYYQGWDFTVKKNIYPQIPKKLRIFAGDNYIFATLSKQGYKHAMIYSSPILHYKAKTRINISNIHDIHMQDVDNYKKIMIRENLKNPQQILHSGICNQYPQKNFKLM